MYHCIYMDPPWNEKGGGKIKRGADKHYPVMKTPQIVQTVLTASCWKPADNSHLWMYVTNNFLEDGLFVMKALGFRYVTNGVWAKDRFGLGQYMRGQHELMLLGARGEQPERVVVEDQHDLLLFGVRGRQAAQTKSRSTLIGGKLLPRRKHSQKPMETYELIEAVSPGPRLEMFARTIRPGWEQFGNEVIE